MINKDLFVLDIANNHQGDLSHAKSIIDNFSVLIDKFKEIDLAIKFQFRDLDTFIHPSHKNEFNTPNVQRFLSTRLEKDHFKELIAYAKEKGFITIATPFDEKSIQMLIDLNVEILKIASCSANDWPLIDDVVKYNKPVIASTGGLSFNDIDKLVFKLQSKNIKFDLMHCVSIYPTPNEMLELNQIKLLKNRYSKVNIGFSTHEDPENYEAIQAAYTLGARIFERHIGLKTELYDLNKYSSTPTQINKWIEAYYRAKEMLGASARYPAPALEKAAISNLQRGVYVNKDISASNAISNEDVFFAIPLLPNKLKISDYKPGIIAEKNYKALEPISELTHPSRDSEEIMRLKVLFEAKALLNQSKVSLGKPTKIEFSHHYGFERFREYGAIIFDIVNREYCKKIIVMLPRQKHPYHRHIKKEETFQVLYGELEITINGNSTKLFPGDYIVVEREKWHKFQTLNGVVFEEISTTSFDNDSFYDDEFISKLKREERKTIIDNFDVY